MTHFPARGSAVRQHFVSGHIPRFLLAVLASVLATGSIHAATPRYFVTDLGTFTNAPDYSEAHGINNAGQVVGRGQYINATVPFLWTPGSSPAPLNVGSLPKLPSGIARAINTFGQTAGSSTDGDKSRAFLWTPTSANHPTSGSLTEITGLPGETNHSSATAINDRGQVVGVSSEFAFLWTPNIPNTTAGAAVDLGHLPGATSAIAAGINASGQVAGTSLALVGGNRAFLWTPATPNASTGTMQDLGLLPGVTTGSTQATAVNAAAHVVGYGTSGAAGSPFHAFLHTPASGGGTTLDLGALPGGNGESIATALNAADSIVGYSNTADGDHAFLWAPTSGSLLDLNTLLDATGAGWTLRFATGINLAGQIVGYGTFDPDGPAGETAPEVHAFLLTPLPAVQVGSVARSTNGFVTLNGTSAPNKVLSIETSPDLATGFVFLTTVTAATDGSWHFEDSSAADHLQRFYRVGY